MLDNILEVCYYLDMNEGMDLLDISGEAMPDNEVFKPLIPDAVRVIRRAMLNQTDAKLGVSVAQDLLDRVAGTSKQKERIATPIVIKDSQVQLLVASMQEAREISKRGGGDEHFNGGEV